MSNLNQRCERILSILTHESGYVPLSRLLDKTGISRRSLYYDICKINEWLIEHNIETLEPERGKGILITAENKEKILAELDEKEYEDYYQFLPDERVKLIICNVIHSSRPVYIEQLIDLCHVSRNTVFGDIKIAVGRLQEYNLELNYESKCGYYIVGDPIQIRALFILYYEELRSFSMSGLIPFLNRSSVQEYYDKLCALKDELRIEYVEGSLDALALLLPVMYRSTDHLEFTGLKRTELFDSLEYQMVCKYFPDLRKEEQIYLSLHLLGSRLSIATDEIFEKRTDQSVYVMTKALVTEFEKTACINFIKRDELERALFLHICASMYRYQYGIQFGNPMCEDVVREYPHLFEITKYVSVYLEQMIGLPIPDSEVAYLALHFGAFMKPAEDMKNHLRILIVCTNGVSTGNMLKHEIGNLLPNAEIVGVAAAPEFMSVKEECDLIISTVKIRSMVPVLVVHPILTDEDRMYILSNSLVNSCQTIGAAEELFNRMKKYVDVSQYDSLRKDINSYIENTRGVSGGFAGRKDCGIVEILDASRVCVYNEQIAWVDAIYRAGEILVRNASIRKSYLDAIVSQIMYYGPYMFITEHMVLAHAKAEDGVNRRDLSLAVFTEPVQFPKQKIAKVIFVLSAEDNEKHLKILNDILNFAKEEENLKALEHAASVPEILDLFRNTLQE